MPTPTPAYHQPQAPPAPVYQTGSAAAAHQRRSSAFAPQTPHAPPYQSPGPIPVPQYAGAPGAGAAQHTPYQANRLQVPAAVHNPNAPRPIEVFHLSDAANAAIPADIREQFHCDDQGRVLFFSTPPLDIVAPVQQTISHSLKYLAAREQRRKLVEQRKRQRDEELQREREEIKRRRLDEAADLALRVQGLTATAVDALIGQIRTGTEQMYRDLYGDEAENARLADMAKVERRVKADRARLEQTAKILAASRPVTVPRLRSSAI